MEGAIDTLSTAFPLSMPMLRDSSGDGGSDRVAKLCGHGRKCS
jgi:hypothetical protein